MTKEQLRERYDELYDKMKMSRDVKNMKTFGKAERYMFHELAGVHPEMAERWLSHLEPICWDNYLSQSEALNIGKRIVNQDGKKGFHWDYPTFSGAVVSLGGKTENKPHYNSFALWVVANMEYSDHANSVAEDMGYRSPAEVPDEKMALSMYKKAVEYLEDADGGFSVRDYFRHRMYDEM